jgi:hypothetical protein
MLKKEILKEIVNRIIDYGYHEGAELHVVKKNKTYAWDIVAVDGESTEVSYSSSSEGDKIEIPLKDYAEDNFLEDAKDELALDLMYLLSEWEEHLSASFHRKGQAAQVKANLKKDPDYFKKMAQKRWGKKTVDKKTKTK